MANKILEALSELIEVSGEVAPNRIEFVNRGKDHLMWTIGIGKNHTATLYMHKDGLEALRRTRGDL